MRAIAVKTHAAAVLSPVLVSFLMTHAQGATPPVRTEVGFGLFVGSGYSAIAGQPGNVLLAFAPE